MSKLHLERSYEEEVRQIAELVFATMLDLEVTQLPADTPTPAGLLTAAVYFAGTWRGAVLIECTERDACILAERLMGIPRPAGLDEDVRDSLSELANMVGGNLKPVLPHGVALSMPSLIEGRQYALRLAADVNTREAFSFGDDPMWLTLVETPEPRPSRFLEGAEAGSTRK